jgi:cleavage and polyadenylation specificity factor subunit 3
MLIPAELPPQKPDILICESTFGTASHEPRPEKEARLTSLHILSLYLLTNRLSP